MTFMLIMNLGMKSLRDRYVHSSREEARRQGEKELCNTGRALEYEAPDRYVLNFEDLKKGGHWRAKVIFPAAFLPL